MSKFLIALAVAGCLGATSSSAQTFQDEGTAVGVQCAASSVNNVGEVVGTCVDSRGLHVPFYSTQPGVSVSFPLLVAGQSCGAGADNDAGEVVGECADANDVAQAVYWITGSGTVNPLAALLGDVSSSASAINAQGAIVGVSSDGTDVDHPVLWAAGTSNAVLLPMGLLNLAGANCVTVDVQNGSGTQPVIIGNCPDGSGHNTPVIWTPTGLFQAYVPAVLSKPWGAVFCAAGTINDAGYVLGACDFGPSKGSRTAVWLTPTNTTLTPLVLNITDTSTGQTLRNDGIAINAKGEVVGQYQFVDGFSESYYWNVVNDQFQAIPPLPNGGTAAVSGISDTSVVIGVSETGPGTMEAFLWTTAGGALPIPFVTGGDNDGVTDISRNGCYVAGASEVSSLHNVHATVAKLCTPS
ncbi:HAF repeat-containing protein [Burkholderia alba]|uniref:HAF repeat-containing protein n=1 Tax=Burkholderia alba TaxID=2683677 RepID=UPI002B054D34|nr:HAF repeat-containing protein [Burkholderia alba]